ncbi:hypothetical protein QTP88_012525 [Uroleucon formosanum]
MSFRKHESGASKRRALKIRNEYEAKIPKLSNFFQPIKNPALEPKMKKTVGEIDTNTDKKILTELEINKDASLKPEMNETVSHHRNFDHYDPDITSQYDNNSLYKIENIE